MLMSLVWTLLILASPTLAQSNQECYQRVNRKIWHQPWGWYACSNTAKQPGGAQLCCIEGYECGEDSICHKSTSGGQDMWMVGGCTDPKYGDSVCRRDCSEWLTDSQRVFEFQRLMKVIGKERHTFITYDRSNSVWECCGDGGCQDGITTGEKFKAVSPAEWTPVDSGPSPTNSPSSNSDDNGLGLGAKIGIGVAIGVVLIALIAGAIFFFFFRRTNNRSRPFQRGPKGKYEEIGRTGRAPSPQPYAGGRASSPQPYGRSTSPVPPLRSMEAQRGRSRSPHFDERSPLPTVNFPDHGDGP